MTSAFSWKNSISLCPASFCTPRPDFPVTPGVFLTSYFCIPVTYNEKDSFWVLVLKALVGLHRTIQLQLLQLFTALDLAYITSHIQNWVLFLLWLHPFILSGAICPLISSSILGTYRARELSFSILSFCLFILFLTNRWTIESM